MFTVAFRPQSLKNTLGEYLSEQGIGPSFGLRKQKNTLM